MLIRSAAPQQHVTRVFRILEELGHAAMDLGFGALLEKFEEYFGRRTTRLLLILIGLSLVAACVSMIWTWLISPILTFLETPLWQRTLVNLAIVTLAVGGGVSVGLSFATALTRSRELQKTRVALDQAKNEGDAMLESSRNLLTKLVALAEEELAIDNPNFSDERRAKFLADIDIARASLKRGMDDHDGKESDSAAE